MLRPLPYQDPARLVAITAANQSTGRITAGIVGTDVDAWRPQSRALSSMAAFTFTELPIRVGDRAFSPTTALVDPEFLPTLGITPALGQHFAIVSPAKADPGVIITDRLWRTAFGADPNAIGRPVNVTGAAFTLIGVLPPTFQFPRSDAAYSPEPVDLLLTAASFTGFPKASRNWFGIGRLGPGVSLAQAQAEMATFAGTLTSTPAERDWKVRLVPLGAETARASRPAVLVVMGISIVLLVIAVSNLINLTLSRAAGRAQELALRRAVGASAGRVVRQLLTESGLVACAGGTFGVLLAAFAITVLVPLSPVHLPTAGAIEIDGAVLVFTVIVCVAAAIAAGLVPALHANRHQSAGLRVSGTRVAGGGAVARIQRTLSVAQMALGVGLLAGAGLLAHSLFRLSNVDPGFRTEQVFGFALSVPQDRDQPRRMQFAADALDRIRDIPGVVSAGWITFLPPELRAGVFMRFAIAGDDPAAVAATPRFCNNMITSTGYFATVDMPLVRGRDFAIGDVVTSRPVAIVNEAFVRRFFADREPLGHTIGAMFDNLRPVREIVGVVRDAHDRGLAVGATPTLYIPVTQFALSYGAIAVRARVDAAQVIPEIRARLTALDAGVPLVKFETLDDRLHASMREPRFYALLATACALLAVVFVTFGLYGVVAYSVSRRTSEFGIRMAIGADRGSILRLVLRQGVIMAAVGVGIGLGLAVGFGRLLRTMLFEISPADPWTLGLAGGLVVAVTVAASFVPAFRASRVDPIVALRCE
jgi:putative ABC transport system permease protein